MNDTVNYFVEEKEIALKAIKETRSQKEVPNFFLKKFKATKVAKIEKNKWRVHLIGYTFFHMPSIKGVVEIERDEQGKLRSTNRHYQSHHKFE